MHDLPHIPVDFNNMLVYLPEEWVLSPPHLYTRLEDILYEQRAVIVYEEDDIAVNAHLHFDSKTKTWFGSVDWSTLTYLNMPHFGEKLLRLRMQHNMSIEELADMLDYQTTTLLQAIEHGSAIVPMQVLFRVAAYFKVSHHYFFDISDDLNHVQTCD